MSRKMCIRDRGYKTRKTKNVNDKFIVRRRNGK